MNWQETEQGGRPAFNNSEAMYDEPAQVTLGYLVPNRVAEMLAPSRSSWGIA